LVQDLRQAQSNAFLENKFYKISFNLEENKVIVWKNSNSIWKIAESREFKDTTEIIYLENSSNNTHIMYGPNGNAYQCSESQTPSECLTSPLISKSKIAIKNEKKEIIIEFLSNNGFVSSNISVK